MATASGALEMQTVHRIHERIGLWRADDLQHTNLLLQASVPHQALRWKCDQTFSQSGRASWSRSLAACAQRIVTVGQRNQQYICCFDRKANVRPKKRTSLVCAAAKGPIGDVWKEVVDPAAGKVYYWNTATNQTSWSPPDGWEASNKRQSNVSSTSPTSNVVSDDALLEKLMTADMARFGAECEPYRTRLFENEDFANYLNSLIRDTEDSGYRYVNHLWELRDTRQESRMDYKRAQEELEKLRARLANPLLKNPQPFDDNTLEVNF